jgi:tetratricopeptide (TPR) repeat protein
MLLDHYFYAKDLRKCLEAINAIESRVGSDGMTQLLRASIHSVMGMPKEAITHASEAIRLEPDFTSAYFSLAQSHVLVGQFGEAIDVYKRLETDFGYEFSKEGFAGDENFKKFIASSQFKKWLEN